MLAFNFSSLFAWAFRRSSGVLGEIGGLYVNPGALFFSGFSLTPSEANAEGASVLF